MLLACLCSSVSPCGQSCWPSCQLPPVEFWVAVPSSLHPPLAECIQISLSNIRSSYVKNKSKRTSKGEERGGMLHAEASAGALNRPRPQTLWWIWLLFLTPLLLLLLPSRLPKTPCTTKMGPAFWSESQSQTWSLISGGLALAPSPPALFLLMDLGGPANRDPCQPTPSVCEHTHTHTLTDNAKPPQSPTGKEGKKEGKKKCLQMCWKRLWIKVSSLTEITGAVSVVAAFIVSVLIS